MPLLPHNQNDLGYSKAMAQRIILTNMCMVYRNDGSFLVENRLKNDWPGINFPGGHVEPNESLEESVIREMKEETGLTLSHLENVGVFEWNVIEEGVRHLCVLYRTKDFKGSIKSSKEGPIFWLKEAELKNYPLSTDFEAVLAKMKTGLDW